MDLDIAGLTHVGRRKEKNEDNFGVFGEDTPGLRLFREGALLAVADGLGGHIGGEIASKLAVSIIRDLTKEPPPEPAPPNTDVVLDAHQLGYLPLLRSAIKRANDSIFQTNRDLVQGDRPMGTTLLTALVEPKTAWIGNVGDSRAYHLRGGEIIARTEDHSWVDEQVKLGLMSRDEAESDKRRNLVTRSVGTHPDTEADTYRWPLAPGDMLLLCTDGLVNMVRDADIAAEMSKPLTAAEIAENLVRMANENGGRDNITVVVAHVNPDRRRMAARKMRRAMREKGISPALLAGMVFFGLLCFGAGIVAALVL